MQLSIRRTGGAGAARAALLARLLSAVLALTSLPAFAASASATPLRNPHLASMQIEIWPEFDRPAALVILRGALAVDAKLPADVMLRIPASTGGPSAMAYSAVESGNLLNLQYDREDAAGAIALRFKALERFFHIEFYDPLPLGKPERSYSYVWPGDFSVDRLNLVVQEPATASNFSVQPNLGATASGQDGLRYRSGELGAHSAGKQLSVKLSYTKPDARTSTDILGQKAPAATPAPTAGAGAAATNDEVTKGVLVFILLVSLLIAAGTAVMWWRGRAKLSPTEAGAAGFCAKCGAARAADDRFCSKCGARLS